MDVLALIGSVVLTWSFIIGLFVFSVFVDYTQSKKDDFGWSVFWTLILAVCLYLHVQPSALTMGIIVGAWIPLGMVWAVVKWKLRISKTKYEISSNGLTPDGYGKSEYNILKNKLDVDRVKSTIAYWVMFFPISIFSTCFVNVFDAIEYLVTVKFGSMFKRMAAKAFE